MNISKLAKTVFTTKETIRFYREKNLLKPKQNLDNNYFEYGIKELNTILFIKKMRYFGISVTDIEQLLSGADAEELSKHYKQQILELQNEKKKIEDKISHLNTANTFLTSTIDKKVGQVYIQQFEECRYDVYPSLIKKSNQEVWQKMMDDSAIYINTIRLISNDIWNEDREVIPLEIGLGINNYIISKYDITPPKFAIKVKSGSYLVTVIKMKNLEEINKNVLSPLYDYAKEHSLKLTNDITTFLAYIDNINDEFYYRFRVKIDCD